jgi:hypothetical protein
MNFEIKYNLIASGVLISFGILYLLAETLVHFPLPGYAYVLLILLAIIFLFFAKSADKKIGFLNVFLTIFLCLILHYRTWNDRKRVILARNEIEKHISIGEVNIIASKYDLIKVFDGAQSTTHQRYVSFVPSRVGNFNSDLLVVYFENDRVVRTEFYMD